jgi:hypothetical protein
MKSQFSHSSMTGVNCVSLMARVGLAVLILSWHILQPASLRADQPGKLFLTPAEAANALGEAARATNRTAFHIIFGPDADWMANPDTVQGENEIANFNDAYASTNWLARKSDTQMTLMAGTNAWPFPVPIVKGNGGWYFDTTAGREEIINRRIGRNELAVLDSIRAYVDAQREYASVDRDGSRVLKYAQKIVSSPGKTDGLYWPEDLNGEASPLGPLVADAQNQGYFKKKPTEETGPRPFHGYYFKILTQQGKHAPGGKYDYVINGNMIGGFALVAWPAEYGETGIMSFMVNQEGRVYQKDLGKDTDSIARKMTAYDPDSSWQVSPQ